MRASIGTSIAVHIMIDMSGSMDGNSSLGAKKAAYAFAKACASIKGVNVGVSVFNNAWSIDGKEFRSVQTLVKHGERSIKSGLENPTRYNPFGGTPEPRRLWRPNISCFRFETSPAAS